MAMKFRITLFATLLLVSPFGFSAEYQIRPDVIQQEVDAWNKYAQSLLDLHNMKIANTAHTLERGSDRYGGEYAEDYRFLEEFYYSRDNKRLLSHIRWHDRQKQDLHTIEVFIYDSEGRLVRDYAAAYLPYERNAPFQTLVNFHHYAYGIHAYRQFDANGEVLFEKCQGKYKGVALSLALEDYEMPDNLIDASPEYLHCFSGLPQSAGKHLDPRVEMK